MQDKHTTYMQQALTLAELGRGTVSPNPMVGCVIVNQDQIVGSGYHQKAGHAHAEIIALEAAGEKAQNATLYVTLEPCAHHGKTPPCTDSIIQAGIKHVYVACIDPNPLVAGKGCAALTAAGIEVTLGVLEKEARALNTIFFHYIQKQRPYVIAKWAMSLDGKTVTNHPQDRHITTGDTQLSAHQLRQQVDAILVGANTARLDNPRLTVRHSDIATQPLRIILSTNANLPLDLQVLNANLPGNTLLVVTTTPSQDIIAHCAANHIEILVVPGNAAQRADLAHLFSLLAARGISSVLVEGGMSLHEQLFQAKLVDKVCVYLAPIIIGKHAEKTHLVQTELHTLSPDYCFTAILEEKQHV